MKKSVSVCCYIMEQLLTEGEKESKSSLCKSHNKIAKICQCGVSVYLELLGWGPVSVKFKRFRSDRIINETKVNECTLESFLSSFY